MLDVGSARWVFVPELTRDRFGHFACGDRPDDSAIGVAYDVFIFAFHSGPAFPAHPHKTP
jgi:hypothetical protein